MYLVGIALLALSYLLYSLAQDWGMALLAMVAYWLGFSTSTGLCHDLWKLPGQPGPRYRDDDLRDRRSRLAGDGRAAPGCLGGGLFRRRGRGGIRPLYLLGWDCW